MADAFLVLRVLADADVELVVVDDRRRDEVAARPLAAEPVHGSLGLQSNFQIRSPVAGSRPRASRRRPGR